MLTMAGLMVLATVTHSMVRPLPTAAVLKVTEEVVDVQQEPGHTAKEELVGSRLLKK